MIFARANNADHDLRCNQIIRDFEIDNHRLIDLLNIFLEIFVQDITVKRSGKNARLIQVECYISNDNLTFWEEQKDLIQRLARFVTEGDGDIWNLNYIPSNYVFTGGQAQVPLVNEQYDTVSLLSGGLDSFCGVQENLNKGLNTIYCGYKTNISDASHINKVFSYLKSRYPSSAMQVFDRVCCEKVVATQRTRSLLFFTLATITAAKYGSSEINVYENGIMSLNPSFQSRGTTRTTHPKTLLMYQQILNSMEVNVTINHPFLFNTKAKIIFDLSTEFKENIILTHSCSRSGQDTRFRRVGVSSCGACVPCLLRKISIAANDLESKDHDYYVPYAGDLNNIDYHSAYMYFETFYTRIRHGLIFSELDIKSCYYTDPEYYEKTDAMLDRFAVEWELFREKYGRR